MKHFSHPLTGEVPKEKGEILDDLVNHTTILTTVTKTMTQGASKISRITNFRRHFISEEIQGKISKQKWQGNWL